MDENDKWKLKPLLPVEPPPIEWDGERAVLLRRKMTKEQVEQLFPRASKDGEG